MNRRGFFCYAQPIDWPSLLVTRPAYLVVTDAYHLPLTGGQNVTWRPWIDGEEHRNSPESWVNQAYAQWEARGRRAFGQMQIMNEPNEPDYSRLAAQRAVSWFKDTAAFVRGRWPGVLIHCPPLSPKKPQYAEWWEWMEPAISDADVVSAHWYLDDSPAQLDMIHRLYPTHPFVISECGRPGSGTESYGRELLTMWRNLPPFVRWAAVFQWQRVRGPFWAWGLEGTPAARVLAEEAE